MTEEVESPEPFEFVVGETYVNEKGPFEVMSIKREKMVIKWEDGTERETTVEMQLRIQNRRRHEKEMLERNARLAAEKARRASKARGGASFEGLQSNDFRNKISRTRWRGRDMLGGAVANRIESTRFHFQSWAARNKNAIQWADAVLWKKKRKALPAWFFGNADETSFSWGFFIERSSGEGEFTPGWTAFLEWLQDEENEKWLRKAAMEEGLEIYDARKSCFSDVVTAGKKKWSLSDSTPKSLDSLGALIEKCPEAQPLDLVIGKRIPKKDAIARKKEISQDIANLISRLMPLYRAAAKAD